MSRLDQLTGHKIWKSSLNEKGTLTSDRMRGYLSDVEFARKKTGRVQANLVLEESLYGW